MKPGTILKDGNVYAGKFFSLCKGWVHVIAEKEDISTEFYHANVYEGNDSGRKRGTRVPNLKELKILYKNKDKIGNFRDNCRNSDYLSSESQMEYSMRGWPLGFRFFQIDFRTGKECFSPTGESARGQCRLVKTVTRKELKESL
jgi:hypothetical protein